MCVCVCVNVCWCINACVQPYLRMCMFVFLNACNYIRMCVYTHTNVVTETDRPFSFACSVAYLDVSQQTPTASTTATEWRVCASEGEQCSCPGGIVRYGANAMYAPIIEVITSIGCNNNVFGDPIRGTVKSCECTTPTPSTTPTVICVCLCICTHTQTHTHTHTHTQQKQYHDLYRSQ